MGLEPPSAVAPLRRGAIIVRVGGELAFLSSHVARKVMPMPRLARILGAPPNLLGLTLLEGAVVPVATMSPAPAVPGAGPRSSLLVLLSVDNQAVGLTGLEVVASGVFDVPSAGAVRFEGATIPELDLTWLAELGRPVPLSSRRAPTT